MKFTLLALAVVIAFIAVLYEVDSALPKGRRNKHVPPGGHNQSCSDNSSYNRHNDSRRHGTRYMWNYMAHNNFNVTQYGFVKNGSEFAGIRSGNRDSDEHNVTAAFFSYDYTNGSCIGIISPVNRDFPCIHFHSKLTFSKVNETIAANNGTDVKGLPEMVLDGTKELTQVQRDELFESSWCARMACQNRSIVQAAEYDYDADYDDYNDNNTTEIHMIGLEYEFFVTIVSD